MDYQTITPEPLTEERFRDFGEVIQENDRDRIRINEARFDRYVNLASIDSSANDGNTSVSIFKCRKPSESPYSITMLERHPLGSQAIMPLNTCQFIVVVAPPSDSPDPEELRAFITNGKQGINMHRGVWHLPLLGLEQDQEFLVIDRFGADNCDEFQLQEPITLTWQI